MYCSSCGLQLTQELRYCPRCGANLSPPVNQLEPPNLVGPIWAVSLAITLITLTGLGLVFAFALVLVTREVTLTGALFLLITCFLFVVLAIAGLLVRQLSRLLGLYQKPDVQSNKSAESKAKELAGRETLQIEAMGESPLSVTENTTRTFDPVTVDRQTKQHGP